MLDTAFNKVVATSLKNFSRVLTDNITSKQVLLWKLGKMGGIETRAGGTSIVEPIILEDNVTVQSYAGYDPLNMTVSEGITAAEYAWKQIGGTTGLSGIQKFKNSASATQIINLWDAVGKQLSLSMRRVVSRQLFNDGTGNGGKDLTGLLTAVENGDAWSTYGEIDSNANTNWRNQFVDVGDIVTATAADGIALLREGMARLVNSCMGGGDYPHLLITTQTIHEFWETKVLIPNEKYDRIASDEDMARSGFQNFLFKGIPLVWDEDMLPNTASLDDGMGMLALNLDYLKFIMGQGYDFTFTDPIRPDNQDAQTVQCLLYAQLILSNRRRQGRADIEYTP